MEASQDYSVITQSVVTVNVSSSLNSFGSERRFQKNIQIKDLKVNLGLKSKLSVLLSRWFTDCAHTTLCQIYYDLFRIFWKFLIFHMYNLRCTRISLGFLYLNDTSLNLPWHLCFWRLQFSLGIKTSMAKWDKADGTRQTIS